MAKDLNLNLNYDLKILRSRFIAHAESCFSDEQAREIIKQVKSEHKNATHHCWGYVINYNNYKSEFSSDNGEPPGTAGRPILGAIKKRGLENIIVIVTRYFGGKKLGVRGLIEAYGLAADGAIANFNENGGV
ncbi:MAG: YigZ family protein [Synergistaceae bacterium]|nr:YigZ family protein [Synergistaceae bacterium]